MSSSRSPRIPESPSIHATRQMLDELDALMERMLALPVSEQEEASRPGPRLDPPQEVPLTAHLTMLNPAPPLQQEWVVPAPAPKVVPPPSSADIEFGSEIIATRVTVPSFADQPALPMKKPGPQLELPFPALAPEQPEQPGPVSEDDLAAFTFPGQQRGPVATPPDQPQWSWHPLCLINRAFDWCTQPLGWFGRWLRGRWGRNFLGLAGVALLILSLLWLFLDLSHWTW